MCSIRQAALFTLGDKGADISHHLSKIVLISMVAHSQTVRQQKAVSLVMQAIEIQKYYCSLLTLLRIIAEDRMRYVFVNLIMVLP